MKTSLFKSFAKMLEAIPTEAVFRAADLECRMLEEDLAYYREESFDEVRSIVGFRLFLQNARKGICMTCVTPLPRSHAVFYRKTLERLIASGKLPANAIELFDETFSESVIA